MRTMLDSLRLMTCFAFTDGPVRTFTFEPRIMPRPFWIGPGSTARGRMSRIRMMDFFMIKCPVNLYYLLL